MADEKTHNSKEIKYISEYNLEHYDRVEFRLPAGQKAVFQQHAKSLGQSLNNWIYEACKTQMEKQQAENPDK